MDFSNYKFRCHYQGNLISVPKPLTNNQNETLLAYREKEKLTDRQKADWHSLENKLNESKIYKLNTTAENLLTDIVWNEKYGRETVLENKYFVKGIAVEKQSRDLLGEIIGDVLTEDRERKSNEWVIGTRDVKHDEVIIDIKSCYDFNSFTKHLIDSKHEHYFRQLDCYMDLWGLKHSLLAYALIDTPPALIDAEIIRLNYKEDILTIDGDVRDKHIPDVVRIVKNHIYTYEALEKYTQGSSSVYLKWFDDFKEIPKNERIHIVEHSFDKVIIEQRNECLTLCRNYMNNLKINNNINFKLK